MLDLGVPEFSAYYHISTYLSTCLFSVKWRRSHSVPLAHIFFIIFCAPRSPCFAKESAKITRPSPVGLPEILIGLSACMYSNYCYIRVAPHLSITIDFLNSSLPSARHSVFYSSTIPYIVYSSRHHPARSKKERKTFTFMLQNILCTVLLVHILDPLRLRYLTHLRQQFLNLKFKLLEEGY